MGSQNSREAERVPLAKTEVTDDDPEDYGNVKQWLQERVAAEDEVDACEHRGTNKHTNILTIFKEPQRVIMLKEKVQEIKETYKSFTHYAHYIAVDSTTGINGKVQEVQSMTYGDVIIPRDFLSYNKVVDASALSRKYLLLKDTSDPNEVWKLLTEYWNLPKPNLVVSLISGTLSLNSITGKQLNKLLSFLAKTQSWVLSDGMHMGSSLHLSEAVRSGLETNDEVENTFDGLTLIGITQWNDLKVNEKKLLYGMSLEGFYESYYFYPQQDRLLEGEMDGMANPYQDAYLFESTFKEGDRGSLRDNLVKCIRNKHSKCEQIPTHDNQEDDDKGFRPTVSLVIGGNNFEEILAQIKTSVRNKVPVVVVRQSGDAPEEIFRIYGELEKIKRRRNLCEHDFTEEEEKKLKEILKNNAEHFDELIAVMENRHYLTFIQLGENDMIKKFVSGTFKGKKHIRCMSAAMLTESIDFVKVALPRDIDPEFGQDLELTNVDELMKLYKTSLPQDSPVGHVLFGDMTTEGTAEYTLPIVGKLIFELMGWQYLIDYQRLTKRRMRNNAQLWHLFLFAILSNKSQKIIEFLASVTESPLGAALFAHGLLKAMSVRAKDASDNVLSDAFSKKSEHFCKLAKNVLDAMLVADRNLAFNLLNKKLPFELGNNCTALTFAIDIDSKIFLNSICCKTYIRDTWFGSVSIRLWKRIIAAMVPFIGWLWLPRDKHPCCKRMPCHEVLVSFYNAPATKCILHLASFLAFLAVFSTFLLIDLMPISSVSDVTSTEWITFCFVLGRICEEFQQLLHARGSTLTTSELDSKICSLCDRMLLKTKWYQLNCYFSQAWNTLDIIMLVMFFISVVLRFTVPITYFQMVRIMFSLTIIIAYTRILKYFYVSNAVGPRVIAITRMLTELAKMCLVLLIFLIAFGIAFQAVLNPGQGANWEVLVDLLYRPYWQMYGELFLEDASSEMGRAVSNYSCTFLKGNGFPELHCYDAFPFILIAMYLVISNVLLLNLIIAIFSNTLNRVEEKPEEYRAFQFRVLTMEYYYMSPVPPPLNILWCILCGVHKIISFIKRRKHYHSARFNAFLHEQHPGVERLEARAFRNCLQNVSG